MSSPFKPFKSPAVPIIGQPFTLKGGYPTVIVQCLCEAKEPILLIGNRPSTCPSCKRGFAIGTFTFDGSTGQIQAGIALMRQPDAAPEPVGVES